ncbi:MAG: SurA N-terminal domain-containing protein [Myxococcales bacterium]|nr:SurA N-terminal domain-containing protein [Myxococcales bacterium]MCB9643131.1 SurA N-terminal domain-containing protein [Myxococcales bacterium]
MFKKILFFGVCLGLLGGGTVRFANAEEIVIEKIVAVVNNDIVLLSEWERRFEIVKAQLQQVIDPDERKRKAETMRWQILERMIDDKLLDQEARTKQIEVSEADIQSAVKRTREQNGNIPEAEFAAELRKRGYTMNAYKAMMRREIRKFRLLQQAMVSKIRITKEDELAFYKKMIRKEKPGPPEYKIRHIVFVLDEKPKPEQVTELKQKAENVLLLATQNPKNFISLAKRFSQGPSRDTGGDLGYVKISDIDPILGKAIVSMRAGAVYSKVLRTSMGFHVLNLEKIRSSNVLGFEEARPEIRKRLQQDAYENAYKKYVMQLRKKAVIEIRVKGRETEKKVFKSTFGPINPSPKKKEPQRPRAPRGGRRGGFPR